MYPLVYATLLNGKMVDGRLLRGNQMLTVHMEVVDVTKSFLHHKDRLDEVPMQDIPIGCPVFGIGKGGEAYIGFWRVDTLDSLDGATVSINALRSCLPAMLAASRCDFNTLPTTKLQKGDVCAFRSQGRLWMIPSVWKAAFLFA